MPLISILIPFYGAEDYLLRCLESTAAQDYPNIEVVLVNDRSLGKDRSGRGAAQIVKDFAEKYVSRKNFTVRYFDHKENNGTFETRRTCVEKASGTYCCFLDDDDILLPENLSFLYEKAVLNGADIVQGAADILYDSTTSAERIASVKNLVESVHEGILETDVIADNMLCSHGHSSLLWGKLFKTEIIRTAFAQIPHFYGVLADDFMLYYIICRCASRYAGFKEKVYQYNLNTGLTSGRIIDDMARWERFCSSASAFTILYDYFKKNSTPPSHKTAVQKLCWLHILKSVDKLHTSVAPEIYDQAYSMLCDYWGASFVAKAESAYKNNAEHIQI